MSGYHLPKFAGPPDEEQKRILFVTASVFGRDIGGGDTVEYYEHAAAFAYKVMVDMHIDPQQALSILRYFRDEFSSWDGVKPFILSLNDGRYAVLVMEPECRKLYDYCEAMDRAHPTGAIPPPVPVVQASVNLSRVIELGL